MNRLTGSTADAQPTGLGRDSGSLRDTRGPRVSREAPEALQWVRAGVLTEFADNSAIHADLAGFPVCLVRSGDRVHALLDECSHGQVALSDGDVEGGFVECWMHGSRFDLVTGRPTGPPATVSVPVYPVRIAAGVVEIALPAPADGGPR